MRFQSAQNITLQGLLGADGHCHGTLTLERGPNDAPVGAVLVAANPTTCQQVIEEGSLDPASVPVDVSPLGAQDATVPATSQHSGWFQTYWHDPILLVVNDLTEQLVWTYSGGLVGSILAYGDVPTAFSIPGDHWYLTSHNGPTLRRDTQDRWATVSSTASFYNTDFCGGTGTTYQPNTLTGLGSGGDTGSVSTWDWGCDTNLLGWGTNIG